MTSQDEELCAVRELYTLLGAEAAWTRARELEEIIIKRYPQCTCAQFLARVIPDRAKEILKKSGYLFLHLNSADWFLDFPEHTNDVFDFFAEHGCLPLIWSDAGALVLRTTEGAMNQNNTCFAYAEYGDEAMDEEKLFQIGWGLRDLCKFIHERHRAASNDWCADIEELIPDLINPYS